MPGILALNNNQKHCFSMLHFLFLFFLSSFWFCRYAKILKHFGCDFLCIGDTVKSHYHHGWHKRKTIKNEGCKVGLSSSLLCHDILLFSCIFHSNSIFSVQFLYKKGAQSHEIYVITIMNFNMFVFNAWRNKHNCQLTAFCNSLFLLCFCLCFAFLLSIDIFGKFLKNKKKYWSRVQLAICKQKTEIFCYQTTNLFQIWFLFLVSKKALKVNLQLNLQGF